MLVTHILNHGKKPLAYQISFRAVKKIQQNAETNQLFVLCQAIHGATFNIAVNVGGSTHRVPMKMPHILLEEKFISIIQSCKSTKHLEQIQTQIVTHGLQHNEFVVARFLSACAESKRMGIARKVFDYIPEPNIAHWNTLFKGYIKNELYKEVVVLFSHMNNMDLKPNCFIFPMVLKSCGKLPALRKGEEVHCVAIKVGFKSNSFVGTTLIDMYSVVGQIECAYRVFSEMAVKNVVAWTAMINGYILGGDLISARHLFEFSPERDVILWNTMVSGYIELGDMPEARKLFGLMPCRDLMSWNTLLNGYANNGDVEKCKQFFEEMPEKNIFSWNGLLGGYAQNGHFTEVLSAFKRMLNESDVHPNDVTLVNVLSACARLGALDLGKWVHVYAENKRYKNNVYVGNGLIDMYAKCGEIKSAILVFRNMDKKDLISWNTIINGLAIHGHGDDALSLFHEMNYVGEQPDGITFIGILCSCSHLGLVGDGLEYFHSMINEYSIIPQIQHYGCVVDMLARAGLLDEALYFVKKMPVKADGVIWTSLVGACRVYRNTKLAELALEQLIELEPENPSNYVMLSNIYGDARRWGDLARLKVTMRDTGSRKLPGCSLIEVDDGVVEFYSFDERHPKSDDIYGTLRSLTTLLRLSGYIPDLLELGQMF